MTSNSGKLSLGELGQRSLEQLYRMAEDEGTQEKSRIEIYKWIAEMALGKPSVSKPESTPTTGGSVRFEGELEDWAG